MLASKNRTGQEVAHLFNVKLQVVRDLNKDLKGKKICFINKHKADIRTILKQASIAGVVQNFINHD